MRYVFLFLAFVGAILPMYYFVKWFEEFGYSLSAMNDAWFVNDATRGLVWDLTIAALALTIWIVWETVRAKSWLNLIAIPATFCIGVSCGLPLYLYLRTRPGLNGSL